MALMIANQAVRPDSNFWLPFVSAVSPQLVSTIIVIQAMENRRRWRLAPLLSVGLLGVLLGSALILPLFMRARENRRAATFSTLPSHY
jgi:hypothetical protein